MRKSFFGGMAPPIASFVGFDRNLAASQESEDMSFPCDPGQPWAVVHSAVFFLDHFFVMGHLSKIMTATSGYSTAVKQRKLQVYVYPLGRIFNADILNRLQLGGWTSGSECDYGLTPCTEARWNSLFSVVTDNSQRRTFGVAEIPSCTRRGAHGGSH